MKRKRNLRCFNKHSCCPFALSRPKSGSYEHVPFQMFSYILRATLLEVPNFYSCHNIYILILPIQILHVLVNVLNIRSKKTQTVWTENI